MLLCEILQCSVWGFGMNEIADRALETYELVEQMDAALVAQSREKLIQYIAKLTSAGQHDPHRLTEFARAYLRELHQGPDPRFTGC
jgi:hypothetical protein